MIFSVFFHNRNSHFSIVIHCWNLHFLPWTFDKIHISYAILWRILHFLLRFFNKIPVFLLGSFNKMFILFLWSFDEIRDILTNLMFLPRFFDEISIFNTILCQNYWCYSATKRRWSLFASEFFYEIPNIFLQMFEEILKFFCNQFTNIFRKIP